MASKEQVVAGICQAGIMPVFYHNNADVAKHVIDCCYGAGIRIFEFTNRGANADATFKILFDHIQQYPDFILGIGTIYEDEMTRKFTDLGASFIVSPILKDTMAAICHEHNILWIPGCSTLTEIVQAKDLGARIIKLFPASVLGPKFIASVMPVIPGLQLMPTGGIEPTKENLWAWYMAGAVCVGIGSKLLDTTLIKQRDWEKLRAKITRLMEVAAELKIQTKTLLINS